MQVTARKSTKERCRIGCGLCVDSESQHASPQRKEWQERRWLKKGQKWRTGCEGRISVVQRRHGLTHSRYRGMDGMKRWVGLEVIADSLINVAR